MRPAESYLVLLPLLFISFGALYGGGALVLKPDGSLLGMEPWLAKIPFGSFLVPGLILFLFNGVLPLLVVTGLLGKFTWQWPERLNIYPQQHWSWTFSLYCGIITITWITVQQFLTDFFLLQPIVLTAGLLVIVCTMLPRVMRYYSR